MSTSNATTTSQNDAAEHTWESAMAAMYEVDPPFMTAFANYYNATIAKNASDWNQTANCMTAAMRVRAVMH